MKEWNRWKGVGGKRRKGGVVLTLIACFLAFWLSLGLASADQGWLSPGQSFQAKAEKGKTLSVKAKTKKGIVCVLVKTGKKDFDWDLANNKEMKIEPFAYATPEKPGFTVKVDHSDHPEGKIWYNYQ
jgi:hypothetical protein